MSFEKIPRFGPEIGTLGTPGGPKGQFFLIFVNGHFLAPCSIAAWNDLFWFENQSLA